MLDTARHARGVYYTPRWLADLILDEAGYDGAPGVRLLDPSCGEGVFLAAAIQRARVHGNRDRILHEIQGFELDPQSAETARATYLEALGDLAAGLQPADVPVRCVDAILQPPEVEPFDIVAGNPPWVRWDHLTAEYRQATLPLWKRYGLFSL
jgi:type I restriction-modification system DNA methylase subunit